MDDEQQPDVTPFFPQPVQAGAGSRLVGPVKVSVTMPIRWMLRGFDLSLDRLRNAATTQPEDARDLCIALFEVGNWLDSLTDRYRQLTGFPHVRAFLFVRNRTHHNFAAAVFFEQTSGRWTFYPVASLPAPGAQRHQNEKGRRAYEQVVAGRPLDYVLAHLERAVDRTVRPDA